jgi:riboflavin kinase/FMN adenylyltransferase
MGKQHLFQIRGKVRHGDKRGRQLGFPTANTTLHQKDIPDGVYISMVKSVNTDWLPALTFIGAAKTFAGTDRKSESYVIDYSGDLYDQWLTIRLLQFIRGNKKFRSIEALQAAMHTDLQTARRYFDLR